jgi:hypothetical protein
MMLLEASLLLDLGSFLQRRLQCTSNQALILNLSNNSVFQPIARQNFAVRRRKNKTLAVEFYQSFIILLLLFHTSITKTIISTMMFSTKSVSVFLGLLLLVDYNHADVAQCTTETNIVNANPDLVSATVDYAAAVGSQVSFNDLGVLVVVVVVVVVVVEKLCIRYNMIGDLIIHISSVASSFYKRQRLVSMPVQTLVHTILIRNRLLWRVHAPLPVDKFVSNKS